MHPRRKFTIIFRLLAVLVLVAGTTSIGVAQTPREVSPEAKRDTTSRNQPRPAPRYSRDTAKVDTGWLILDGQFIPGPYEVETGESTISVNGVVAVARPPRNKPSPSTTPASSTHAANRALYDTFLVWYAIHGIDSARQRALDFISAHPLVDTAYLEGIKLQVKYKAKDTYEGFLLYSPEDDRKSTEQVLRENLAMLAARLQMHLTSGSLVFLKRSGGYQAILYPRSASVLAKLKQMAVTSHDFQERLIVVKQIIVDQEMARQVAEKFAPEPGEQK